MNIRSEMRERERKPLNGMKAFSVQFKKFIPSHFSLQTILVMRVLQKKNDFEKIRFEAHKKNRY